MGKRGHRRVAAWLAGLAVLTPLAGAAEEAPATVTALRLRGDLRIDGRPDEPDWARARWVTLDRSVPPRPDTPEAEQALLGDFPNPDDMRAQLAQTVRAAALWSDAGLYFALAAEDADVVGRLRDGETLWLEDVLEVFIAPRAEAGAKRLETQVNPAGARLFHGEPPLPPAERILSAAWVDGTLNDSLSPDRGWAVELFFPWAGLEAAGLAHRPGPEGGPVAAVRFARWDLSLFSQFRVNQFTSPGASDPHQPGFYRPLVCLPDTP